MKVVIGEYYGDLSCCSVFIYIR